MLTSQLAAVYAARFSQLLHSEAPDAIQLHAVETRCIEILQEIQSGPDSDPLLPMRLPEFADLRTSERFRQAFPLH